ncbi:hypothetical protein ACVW03_000720 [Pantoea agglomerans]
MQFYEVFMSVVTISLCHARRRRELLQILSGADPAAAASEGLIIYPLNGRTENLIFFLIISLLTVGQECLAGNLRLTCR